MAFDPITSGLNIFGTLIDRLVPDKNAAAKMKADAAIAARAGQMDELKMLAAADASQVDVNKVEAASSNLFVAGWRPAAGWTCVAGLAYSEVLQPFMVFAARLAGSTVVFPTLDTTLTMALLTGLLGLGTMRTYEKQQGVSSFEPGH